MIDNPPPQADLRGWLAPRATLAPRSDSERSFLCLSPQVSPLWQFAGLAKRRSGVSITLTSSTAAGIRNECKALRVNIRLGRRNCDSPGLTTILVEDLESPFIKLFHYSTAEATRSICERPPTGVAPRRRSPNLD